MTTVSSFRNTWALMAQRKVTFAEFPRFHRQMMAVSAAMLILSWAGCRATSIRVQDASDLWIAVGLAVAVSLPLPLYWHEKGRGDLRDAALTVPWGLMLAVLLPFPVSIAARLGARRPLRDQDLAWLDGSMGVNVPGISTWGTQHWIGYVANHTYPFLVPLIPVAFFLPAFTGRVRQAQQFLTSNILAFVLGLPLFSLFPAVGPWFGYHFVPRPDQAACQAGLFLVRAPAMYIFHPDGIVCFPSFHVIWAILCAKALWGFRWLRIPSLAIATLIILSTLTTAWHYFADVLAGCLVATVALLLSDALPGANTAE